MSKKKTHFQDYLETVRDTKPSAEVTFSRIEDDGTKSEEVASRRYVSEHAADEMDMIANDDELANRLSESDPLDLDDYDDDMQEDELVEDDMVGGDVIGDEVSMSNPTSDLGMLVQMISKLVEKVEQIQTAAPVIHVPAPVIYVTLPDTRKVVKQVVERDENNLISHVTETVQDETIGDPSIEIREYDDTSKKTKHSDGDES